MPSPWTIGIIGGSGIYSVEGLENEQWIAVDSPWGTPSDAVLCGELDGVRLRFLPRHGRGHVLSPSDLNARANIDVLKRAGCTDILSISAVGSLREEIAPGDFAIADQFIDRTKGRPSSFFGSGFVAHVSMADPTCPRLSEMAAAAIAEAGGKAATGATYLAMEGPQFSTRAESRMYQSWGADIIGMTAMPEAKLAREAELPYALIGMATDYDCWREGEAVDVGEVVAQMQVNGQLAREMLSRFIANLPAERAPSPIDTALDDAVITAPDKHDPKLLAKLDAVARRLLE
ncbi:MAG: S-methyl-5'-thioadenosine phosphorylase [Marinomonas sp.]